MLSFSAENKLVAASAPRSLEVKSKDFSVLRVRVAVIEGSSALLMWHSRSDNVHKVDGLVVK